MLPRVFQSAYKNITSALPFKLFKILVDLTERFCTVLIRTCCIYNLGRSLWLSIVVLPVVKFEKNVGLFHLLLKQAYFSLIVIIMAPFMVHFYLFYKAIKYTFF